MYIGMPKSLNDEEVVVANFVNNLLSTPPSPANTRESQIELTKHLSNIH